jgi:hypothetical protein
MARVLTYAFGFVIIITILLQSILLLIPFVKKLEFNHLCSSYAAIVQSYGYLPPGLPEMFCYKMAECNLEIIDFVYESSRPEFEQAVFKVTARYPMSIIGNDLRMKEEFISLRFEISYIVQNQAESTMPEVTPNVAVENDLPVIKIALRTAEVL